MRHSRVIALLLLFLLPMVLLETAGLPAAVALAATGTALVVCTLLTARSAPAVPPTRVRTAIRDRARRTAFLPQRDPDASGRPRPRAPGNTLRTTTA